MQFQDGENPVFKLRDFNPMVQDEHGNLVPFSGVISIRPVPPPAILQRVTAAMGNGANNVWVGTVFVPSPSEAGEVLTPESLFDQRFVNTATPGRHITRLALRRRHVPRIGSLKTMLLFAEGACADNGATDARGGWAFVFNKDQGGTVKGVLEQKGPDGEAYATGQSCAL